MKSDVEFCYLMMQHSLHSKGHQLVRGTLVHDTDQINKSDIGMWSNVVGSEELPLVTFRFKYTYAGSLQSNTAKLNAIELMPYVDDGFVLTIERRHLNIIYSGKYVSSWEPLEMNFDLFRMKDLKLIGSGSIESMMAIVRPNKPSVIYYYNNPHQAVINTFHHLVNRYGQNYNIYTPGKWAR